MSNTFPPGYESRMYDECIIIEVSRIIANNASLSTSPELRWKVYVRQLEGELALRGVR